MNKFQDRVLAWLSHTFPREVVIDKRERGFRFCEESLELVQSLGITRDEVLELVDYVYSRQVGSVKEEVGGVGITLASVCIASGVSMESCFDDELDYKCWPKAAAIKAKHESKTNKASSLPGRL